MAEQVSPTKDIKREIANKIKECDSILVTVNNNPTVDELATALALTLVIDSMGKHATAIASGRIPDALEFLSPEKTFEDNVDSLRDFIIALNKEKADHLRYKIDGDFVKVFITPYRTTISEDDLEFSRGDYNVELVIALNVKTNDNLDKALQAHGKILHDATVVNITTSSHEGIGDISWVDEGASSLAEMVEDLTSVLDGDNESDNPLIDQAVATALLTGIVSSTDRFSNERTSATTMGAAAKLMKLGADQQLVMSNLDKFKNVFDDDLSEESPKTNKNTTKESKKTKKPANELAIDHSDKDTGAKPSAPEPTETPREASSNGIAEVKPTVDLAAERSEEAARLVEQRLAEGLAANANASAAGASAIGDLQAETDRITQTQAGTQPTESATPDIAVSKPQTTSTPVLQGAVNDWQRHVLPGTSPVSNGLPTDDEPPMVPSIEDAAMMPQSQSADPGAQGNASIFGSALPHEQPTDQPSSQPPVPATPAAELIPESAPIPDMSAPATPVDMSNSPFVPPVPPPPVPDFSAESGLPLPPDVQPVEPPQISQPMEAQPTPATEPIVPEPISTSGPVIPTAAPDGGSLFENNTPVMPDQVYPQAAQNTDIGEYRIPGS
ncbi:MAG: hypothetical protein LBH36_00445 [Candidatus Nomurabacteria bacterium]|jgi:hypothetical protein|nr:hypothetical protein [Candidatus Nomurabacteria bacterium]